MILYEDNTKNMTINTNLGFKHYIKFYRYLGWGGGSCIINKNLKVSQKRLNDIYNIKISKKDFKAKIYKNIISFKVT